MLTSASRITLVGHIVGANPTAVKRTIVLKLLAWDGSDMTSGVAGKPLTPAPKRTVPDGAVSVSPATLPASGRSVTISFSSHDVADCTLTKLPTGTNSPVACNGTQEIWGAHVLWGKTIKFCGHGYDSAEANRAKHASANDHLDF